MTKKRAFLETLLVSVIIPVIMWAALMRSLMFIRTGIVTLAVVFIIVTVLYYIVVFFRHAELGGLFVFLTALFSTLLQFVTSILIIVVFLSDAGFGGGSEGHPNGDAILLLVIVVIEPVLINIGAFVVWLIKKIIWLFGKDE